MTLKNLILWIHIWQMVHYALHVKTNYSAKNILFQEQTNSRKAKDIPSISQPLKIRTR